MTSKSSCCVSCVTCLVSVGEGDRVVGGVVLGQLVLLFGVGAIGEQVGGVVAVGNEVDRVSDPHRFTVVAVVPGKFFDRVIAQVHHRDRVGASATIMAPH